MTPVDLEGVSIAAVEQDAGKRLTFAARKDGAVGHYVARVTFPRGGTWSWVVEQGPFGPQALGTIRVELPGAAAAGAEGPAVVSAPRAASGAAGHDGLLLAGVLIALAGAAVLFGDRLARVVAPAHG